jgi:NAD(P)H-nitrite reductase large subunit
LKSGKKIPCDFVILGAGVVPKTDFLNQSGIPLDKDGGISVNASMQVPGASGVYAIGEFHL